MRVLSSLLLIACADKGSTPDDSSTPDDDTPPVDTLPEDYTSLDDLLEPIRADAGLPSLAGLILSGGTITHLGAVGVRSNDDAAAVTHRDRYHLGSCTKAMTATLLAVMVEEGTLSWETTMADAFPGLSIHPDYDGVTLEMLLAHVGGTWASIGSSHPDVWSELWQEGDVESQRAWFAEQVLTESPESTPGTTYAYSNAGYMVVGAAMEAATGESWEALIQAHLFDPLGMTSCGFGAPDSDGSLSQPWGHSAAGTPTDGSSLYADNPAALGPAGTVHCSMADWSRFIAAHLAGARGESTWLTEASFTRMHTPVLSDYALGWGAAERSWAGDAPALNHTGTNTMFFSDVWIAPDINAAYLSATNQGDSLGAVEAAVWALISK